MDTHEREPLIRLSDVPKLSWLPTRNGKRLHVATVYRWAQRGCRGRRLRTVAVGRGLATCESWLWEWFGLLDGQPEAPAPTTPQRQREIARAERELDAAGISGGKVAA